MNPEFGKSFPCENITISRKDIADILVTRSDMNLRDAYMKVMALTDVSDVVTQYTDESWKEVTVNAGISRL